MKPAPTLLDNYRLLLEKVDTLCRHILETFPDQIACGPGCHGCCRHISLFPVEAVGLALALTRLPDAEAARIRERAAESCSDDPCPLLADGLCLLYADRPLICRTHGLPILTGERETQRVDFCPHNFRSLAALPGNAVINLDRLNASLCAVNSLFLTHLPPGPISARERLTIAEALNLPV